MIATLLPFWLVPLGLWLLSLAVARSARAAAAKATASWSRTEGRLEEAGIAPAGEGYVPAVRYSYAVAGRARTGDRLRPGGNPFFQSERGARRTLAGFAPGQPVTVHYDPAAIDLQPDTTWAGILRPWAIIATALLAATMVFVAIG